MGDRREELVADLRSLAERFAEDARATMDPKWSSAAVRVANVLHTLERATRRSAPVLAALERFAVEDVAQAGPWGVLKGTGARGVVDVRRPRSAKGRNAVEDLYQEIVSVTIAMCEGGMSESGDSRKAMVEATQGLIARRTVGLTAPSAVTVAGALARTKTVAKRGDPEAIARASFAALGYRHQLGARERQASSRAGKRKRAATRDRTAG